MAEERGLSLLLERPYLLRVSQGASPGSVPGGDKGEPFFESEKRSLEGVIGKHSYQDGESERDDCPEAVTPVGEM